MSQPNFVPVSPYPQPGEVLDGKYRIERLLGEGGMGAVAKATHMLRRAPVALKFMSPAVLALPGAVERFVNEGVAASQIDSDHVVKVFDVGRMPTGTPYLVMEFLDGCDLGQLLHGAGGRLDVPRAVHFSLQILRALQTAHGAGIIHRDMKPSNVFVIEKDGEPDFVKLVDFGISKVRSEQPGARQANLTRTNSALGTPLYMSPEQARSPRDVDQRADLYSVGAMLYELLAGRTPYTCESGEYTEILFKIFTTEPEPLRTLRPDLPEGLVAAVQRALTREPAARFSSASEMAEALAPFADARSAAVIARLLGGRGRSLVPPVPSQSPTGPAPAAPVPDARAQTFPTNEALRAPRVPSQAAARVPSHMGVTHDGPTQAAPRPSKAPIVLALVGIVLLCVVAGIVVIKKTTGGTIPVTHEPTTTAANTAQPSVTTATVTAPTPSASLEPLPSATTAPSATGSASNVTVTSPSAATAGSAAKPRPPTNLNGVQPHF
jgi:serine/threonine-protein kinase